MRVTAKKVILGFLTLAIAATPLLGTNRVSAAAGPNLLSNPSVETADATNINMPADWLKGNWGNNKAAFTYKTDGHSGSRSLYVSLTSYVGGDAKWYAKPVAVTPSASYTYSDYYMASVVSEAVVQFEDAQGKLTYLSVAKPIAAASWQQTSTTFTTPANIKQLTVFHLIKKNGWLQTDDAYLGLTSVPDPTPTPTPTPTPSNLVPNNSVETVDPANASKPADWTGSNWGTNTTTVSYLQTGHTGNHSLRIDMNGRTDGDAKWSFTPQPVTAGQAYQATDYYQSNVQTEVDVAVTMQDGTVSYYYLGIALPSSAWGHFVSNQFTMPAGAAKATLMHIIFANGWLITDDYSLGNYQPGSFNRAIVSLTFDDAWRSTYTNGLPLMQKYGIVSTQYLLSGVVTDPNYMTVDMMKAFRDAGHEIASHTVTHPDLTTVTTQQLQYELSQSKQDLQSWMGVNVTDFATPYGSYNATVLSAIKQYYSSHRGVESGFNSKDSFDVYDIRVQDILSTTTPAQVAAWVAQAQKDKTWLVLVYHQVDPNPNAGDYNTYPQDLDAELAGLKQSGVTVETVHQAIAEVTPQL
jgi:peptidoglycan/xylan/chitin deacetylase (PgdA/CDA1 family)